MMFKILRLIYILIFIFIIETKKKLKFDFNAVFSSEVEKIMIIIKHPDFNFKKSDELIFFRKSVFFQPWLTPGKLYWKASILAQIFSAVN